MSLLTLQGISKSYPGVTAVESVDLKLASGEVLGLIGKNGAGKSTIIRIIAGVEQPDCGTLFVDGQAVEFNRASDATQAGIAVVHQELGDIPSLTVGENILIGLGYPRRFGLIDRSELRKRAQAALDAINARIDVNHSIFSLSIAQRRMVMLARGVAANAKIVILDEPTASLTDAEIADLFAAIQRMKDAGVAIIYVSHRLEEILKITSRVAVMRDGVLVDDRASDTLDEATLVALISGKREVSARQFPKKKPQQTRAIALKVEGLVPLKETPSLDLVVHKGEIVGLAGLAGSGRSEILRQIMGADANDQISHTIGGRKVAIKCPRDAWFNGIALVPEDRRTQGAILQFTIARNVTLASMRKHRLSQKVIFPSVTKENAVTRQLVNELKIKVSDTDTKVGALSGGNQQKVVLARCLAADADILLLDEPTHGVDVSAKEEIYRVIRELAESGKAIIIVSSELKEIEGLVDRALVLREGHQVATLFGSEVTEDAVLTHSLASRV
ncbi:MAG: sugar ABC transporter ATP-binding protein [Hyphomicrobiales bacterium]